jgi:hypothetical protein
MSSVRIVWAPMPRERIEFIPHVETKFLLAPNLPRHMRKLCRRNKGAWRWIALAVLSGAIAALAYVNFLGP